MNSPEFTYGQYATYEGPVFGPEEVMIYTYNEDQDTYLVRFANSEDFAEVPAEMVH